MYVESSDCCNDLTFKLGNTGVGTSVLSRSWTIKVCNWPPLGTKPLSSSHTRFFPFQVTQYSCNHPNLAPQGCTQYYFGETTATVQSFNYNSGNGKHLANQDQQICVR